MHSIHKPKDELPLKCMHCDRKFAEHYRLKSHQRSHTENIKNLLCDFCPNTYRLKETLRRHLIDRHMKYSPEYKCDKCSFTTKAKKYFRKHQKHHNKEFKCPKCSKRFADMFNLKKHLVTHDDNRVKFICHCKESFKTKRGLEQHQELRHQDGSSFPCNECSYIGKTKVYLKDHQKIHDKKFKCRVCEKMFAKLQVLKNHLKYVHEKSSNEEETTCFCGKKYDSVMAMQRHKSRSHDKKFNCPKCSHVTNTNQNLKIHMLKHNKSIPCTKCEKEFATEDRLISHMKQHVALEDLICSCKKKFKSLLALQFHKKQVSRSLLNENHKAECRYCQRTFDSIHEMRKHRKQHEKLICDCCDLKFVSKTKLQVHFEENLRIESFENRPLNIKLKRLKMQIRLKRVEVEASQMEFFNEYLSQK